ncbi:MAG: 4Fe-4S binding protein [bacterium]|nr:4Fe-4S binding protein [bacterium]
MNKKQKNRIFVWINVIIICLLIIAKTYQEKTKKEDISLEIRSLSLVYPEADGFSEKKGSPPHYEVYAINEKGEKKLVGLCFLSTDFAPDIRGYAGKIRILIGMNNKGQVKGIKILSHNETPSYVQTLQEPVFTDQFKKLDHKSEFKLGRDLDGITRATISSQAVVSAVEKSIKLAANKFFNLEVKQKISFEWKDIYKNYNIYIITLFFVLAIYFYLNGIRYGRYFILTGAILYFGFLELNYISIISLINIFTGRIPDIVSSLSWYFLFVLTFITTMLWGRIYCGWICPFGAIQELLGKISPFHVKILNDDEKKARLIKYYLLILIVGAVFVTGNIGFTNYEPFNTIFSLRGEIIFFAFLIFLLITSFFIFRFWCRYLCGVGAFLSLLSNFSIFPLKAKKNCDLCRKCEAICPLEICSVDEDIFIEKGECIQCNLCREQCKEKVIKN